jgi:hypothetical protein
MLGNLDNEIIFKKAFTNKIVFTRFVKDILGIEIEADKIETEKRFEPKIGYIDFELDIFAESVDKRVVVEIQRIEYDHNFDRFLYYFLMTIAEQQKCAANYSIPQTIYVIVVLTAPYRVSERNGKLIKSDLINFDNLTTEERAFSKNKEAAKEAIAFTKNLPKRKERQKDLRKANQSQNLRFPKT